MLLGGTLLFLAIFIVMIKVSYVLLLIYSALVAFAYPLVLVPFLSMSYDVIGKGWQAAEMRIEYIVVKEIFLNSGRLVAICLFLLGLHFSLPKQLYHICSLL